MASKPSPRVLTTASLPDETLSFRCTANVLCLGPMQGAQSPLVRSQNERCADNIGSLAAVNGNAPTTPALILAS